MMNDFFEKQPTTFSVSPPKRKWAFLFRCVFYTSLAGFITGSTLGYLHIKGWVPNAEKSLILYGIIFGMGAVLSTAFVLSQERQNQLKAEKIRCLETPRPSGDH